MILSWQNNIVLNYFVIIYIVRQLSAISKNGRLAKTNALQILHDLGYPAEILDFTADYQESKNC